MTPLVSLSRVSVEFPVGGGWPFSTRKILRAVDRVSLDIAPGETLALVGESGSGKTTLGHAVAGLRPPTSGTIRVNDNPGRGRRKRPVQVVFQDPFGALDPRMPVAAIVGEPLRVQHLGSRAAQRRLVAELLAQVGLPQSALNRYPHEFSGGQRQRIAIARALAPDPALIVADEPLSALDVSIQSQILNLLADLRAASGVAYLFISHDLAVVSHIADRVAVMYLGRLVELAPRELLFARPSHPYTIALLEALPRIGRGQRAAGPAIRGEMPSPLAPPSGCVFHPRCVRVQPICREVAPGLDPAPGRPAQRAACHFKD